VSLIFPGMDPYLEHPVLWLDVHASLVVYIREQLQPRLRPRYVAAIEQRVYLEGPDRNIHPDVSVRETRPGPARQHEGGGVAVMEAVEVDDPLIVRARVEPVREAYVAILDLHASQRVVTVIEVVSPTNKQTGPGRDSYVTKQEEVLSGDVHLVEIDLLRRGPHVLAVPEKDARQRAGRYDSLTCVNRAAGQRDLYELYPRRLRDRLPRIRIPLADGDGDVVLDIQAVVAQAYDAGAYRDRIDYSRPCDPPLAADDNAWAEGLVREAAGKTS
jgi:Protein of unknown function (DUF4058)